MEMNYQLKRQIMKLKKIKEIQKEKLDDIFVDDKDLIKKNKKKTKTKTNKKNKPIDFLDYAKEKGLDINLEYEETKQLEFPKEYNKKFDNKNRTSYPEKKYENKDNKKEKENWPKKRQKMIEKDLEYDSDQEKKYNEGLKGIAIIKIINL